MSKEVAGRNEPAMGMLGVECQPYPSGAEGRAAGSMLARKPRPRHL